MRIGVAAVVLASFASSAHADGRRPVDKGTFGVGIVLGEPTGVCAKLYLKDDQALQLSVGFAFIKQGIQVDVDYVFHPWVLVDRDAFVMPAYLGPRVRFIEYQGNNGGDYFAPGIGAVIGLLFDFKNVPLDAFLEVAGVGEYGFSGHGGNFAFNAGAGIRYYF
jgi:hypothetical protein